MQSISAKDLKKKLEAGETLEIVDLQDPHEYEHRHIPGAMNVPIDETCKEECAKLVKEKDTPIVVCGEFDEIGKAEKASGILVGLGCKNVSILKGGLMGWMEAGFQVEGGKES